MINKFKIQSSKFKQNRGFTLIELLIYAGMLSILLAVFTTLFGMIVDSQLELESTSSVQQDSQYILMKLSRDIMKADSVASPSSVGQSGSTMQLTINSIAYTYSVDGNGDLIVTTASGSSSLNSYRSSISDISFTRIGNVPGKSTVQFTYKVTSRTRQSIGYESLIATSTASLR